MKAHENASLELKQLREVYDAACYAFAQTDAVIAWRANRSNRKLAATTGLVIPKSVRYRPKRSAQAIVQLRELIFIRLVSVLETYPVDSVRDVFVTSKEPFKEQVQLQFTKAEMLSASSMAYVLSKIINRECRSLTNGGYGEIVRYYKKRFGLDLGSLSPGRLVMEEYHERRHLFVHRLGKADARYRNMYYFSGNMANAARSSRLTSSGHFSGNSNISGIG